MYSPGCLGSVGGGGCDMSPVPLCTPKGPTDLSGVLPDSPRCPPRAGSLASVAPVPQLPGNQPTWEGGGGRVLVPPLPMQWAENIHLRHRDASVVSQCRSAPQPTAPSPARLRPPSPVMLWWVLGAGAVCREGGAKAELLEEGGVSVLRGNSQAPWLLALGCQGGGDGLKGSPLLSRFPKLLSHGGRGGKSLGMGGGMRFRGSLRRFSTCREAAEAGWEKQAVPVLDCRWSVPRSPPSCADFRLIGCFTAWAVQAQDDGA